MTEREQAAHEHAKKHSQAPDKETPDWIITDFLAGCEHADKEHREFYLNVRDYFKWQAEATRERLMEDTTDDTYNKYAESREKVKKALAAFTEREINQLPFKK